MHNLILAYLDLRRLAHARYWLNRAAKLRPNDPQTRLLRGRLLRARIVQVVRKGLGFRG